MTDRPNNLLFSFRVTIKNETTGFRQVEFDNVVEHNVITTYCMYSNARMSKNRNTVTF